MIRLTATKLADYARCGFLYKALHVHRVPTGFVGRWRGRIVHAVTHVHDSYATRSGAAAAVTHLLDRIESEEERRRAEELVAAHERLRSGRPQILIEKTLTASIDRTEVRVRPDRVERDDVGELVVEDMKTGGHVDDGHERIKMLCATVALQQRYGARVSGWNVVDLAAGERRAIRPVLGVSAAVGELAGLIRAIRDEAFDPVSNPFCPRCPARAYCPAARTHPRALPVRSRDASVPNTPTRQMTLF